jgi:outer membrane protein assembly factor BamD (BamD/ComL family)
MVEAYRESKESFNNAESYCKKGAFTEALASIDEALKIFPNPDFETLRGQINKNIEAKKQADKLYEEANAALGKSEIKSAFVLILKAISLLPQIVKYNELKRQISKVYGEKLFEQAQNLFAEKDYKGCLETMTECLSVAPSHQKYLDFYIKVEKHQKKRVFIKRCIIFCFLVVILPITGLSIFHILKSNKDANAWVLAEKLNSIQSYYHYLTDYPNGNFSVFATTRICVINKYEEIAWNQAKQVDLIPVYSIFIKTYPNSSYVKKAQAYILTFNIRKWAGMYSSDEQYCNGENFKMEINASLSCTLRTLNGYTWKGKAEIDVDSVVIRFENTPIDDITQGKIYRSFARCNINRPAIILADLNGKLCTAFPQAFDENDRKAHIFFKKKQSNLRNVDPLMLLRYGRKNKSTVSMTHEYLIVKTQLKEIQIQKKILQMFSGNDNTHYLT